jgi:hypothetical protein
VDDASVGGTCARSWIGRRLCCRANSISISLAGKSTLNRLELGRAEPTRYHKIGHRHRRPAARAAGGAFFPRLLRYLPLYVFCGRDLLAAKLRPANPGLRRGRLDASAGSLEEVARSVAQIRQRWPKVRILLRAGSGFARDALMTWCENNGIDFLFGLAKNARLSAEIESELAAAQEQSLRTGKPARRFKDFTWRTRKSWSRERRVVAKAKWTGGAANPRFVVT